VILSFCTPLHQNAARRNLLHPPGLTFEGVLCGNARSCKKLQNEVAPKVAPLCGVKCHRKTNLFETLANTREKGRKLETNAD
jgi:hypothetical protein